MAEELRQKDAEIQEAKASSQHFAELARQVGNEKAALETMKYYGVQPEAWAPLGGGRYKPFENEMLAGIAAAHCKTIGQVVLRWNVQRGVVVIPKSTHKERIEENYDIWDFSLTDEEMKQISSLDMGYQGTAIKHFDPDFVRMCMGRKIHD